MLNNFIYAQTKDLFVEALEAGNILDEAVVFIEDTKEIWNHGHYFAGFNPAAFAALQANVDTLQTNLNHLDAVKLEQSDIEIQSGTYETIKTLKDNSELVPGKQYKILNYSATVSGTNVSANGLDFPIIVTAIETNRFDEKAIAEFGEENREVWYCFDNDTSRFDWANSGGKGVIYRMIDRRGNDVPYDYEGILFLVDGSYEFSLTSTCYSNTIKPCIKNGKRSLNHCIFGVNCSGNILDENCYNIRLGSNCLGNTFGQGCFNITMGDNCQGNSFDTNCHDNTFGEGCSGNEFDTNCHTNTFGTGFSHNKVMMNCYSNNFSFDCVGNVLGPSCYNNTFGNDFSRNTLGRRCFNNKFGTNWTNNTIGNDVHDTDLMSLTYFVSNWIDDNANSIIPAFLPTNGSESNTITKYHIRNGAWGSIAFHRGNSVITTISNNSEGARVVYCQDDILGNGVATTDDIDTMWSAIVNGYYSAATIGEFEETEE